MLRPVTRPAELTPAVPQHLLLGAATHGVTRYAGEVAAATGAAVAHGTGELAAGQPVHLHVTDRLLDRDPTVAAGVVEQLAERVRLTVTLHDVPQPTDGPLFRERVAAYARIVRASHAWATNSWHEHALVGRWCGTDARGTVIHLPVPRVAVTRDHGSVSVTDPVVGVFGFVYPGKGHRQVARAAAALRRAGTPLRMRVLGDAAPDHADEVAELVRTSRARGVPVEVTGRVADDDLARCLRAVAVPVVAHRNVSASASMNSWIAAGRRPLVRDGVYAREMAELRPGTITLFDDSSLVPTMSAALARPATTWTSPDADLGPRLEDTAAAYRSWWASVDA